MIDRELKRCLGQMVHGVQVVAAEHDGLVRAYTSHWIQQVSFDEPILVASVSPKHDTHPVLLGAGRFAVSILAADQLEAGQYFSYPGHKMRYVADELLEVRDGWPVVPDAIAWLGCVVLGSQRRAPGADGAPGRRLDHELVFGEVVAFGAGRLGTEPLLYSARHGWRVTGAKARQPGTSVRDGLLARAADADAEGGGP